MSREKRTFSNLTHPKADDHVRREFAPSNPLCSQLTEQSIQANALKDQANKAFAAKQYDSALDLYSQAIALDPKNHVLYSNRSAAYAGKKQWDLALQDAEEVSWVPLRDAFVFGWWLELEYRMLIVNFGLCKTIKINPTWSKGFARKGAALHGAKKWDEAIGAYEEGLKLEGDKPTPALIKGLKDVQDAQRTRHVICQDISPRSTIADRGYPLFTRSCCV